MRHARTTVAIVVVGLCALAHVATAQPGRPARPTVGDGTASIDVFAQDMTVDLLTTERDGANLELRHQRSVDGGATWSAIHVIDTSDRPISMASRGNEPQVVAHGDHVVVHWSAKGGARFGAGPMVTAVSADAGASWRPGPNPAPYDADGSENFADMTADTDGTLYVAWIGSHDGPSGRGLGVARSPDFGATWEHSQLADSSSCACCWNKMISLGPGSVRVLYRDYGIRDMALASTDNAGATWSLDGTVGAFDWEFPGCPHVGGGIAATRDTGGQQQLHALVWTGHEERHGLYWLRSHDDGTSWTDPHRMGGPLARHADLSAHEESVVAAWDESRGIWVSVSRDLGDTWSAPERISSDNLVASHPIVARTGDAFRLFWTARDDGGLLRWYTHRIADANPAPTTNDEEAP